MYYLNFEKILIVNRVENNQFGHGKKGGCCRRDIDNNKRDINREGDKIQSQWEEGDKV